MYEGNFTQRVRKTLELARSEAGRLGHEYVGTEHILLALIREGGGVASAVLDNLGVDATRLKGALETHAPKGGSPGTGDNLPYTSRAKRVLESSMAEAREQHHSYVGTEHLLLGLLRDDEGIAAQVLRESNVTVKSARAETSRLLGPTPPR